MREAVSISLVFINEKDKRKHFRKNVVVRF